MADHRYSCEYVAGLRSAAAREFLVSVGLPESHVVFVAGESSAGSGRVRIGSRDLLEIGAGSEDNDEGFYCVDGMSGAVVYVDRATRAVFHVNASLRQFVDCLAVFERETAGAVVRSGTSDPEKIAVRLEMRIESIDPTALVDDSGAWRSLLFDVANGDYTSTGGE